MRDRELTNRFIKVPWFRRLSKIKSAKSRFRVVIFVYQHTGNAGVQRVCNGACKLPRDRAKLLIDGFFIDAAEHRRYFNKTFNVPVKMEF